MVSTWYARASSTNVRFLEQHRERDPAYNPISDACSGVAKKSGDIQDRNSQQV